MGAPLIYFVTKFQKPDTGLDLGLKKNLSTFLSFNLKSN